jgi:hypothetical protein
MQEFPRLAPGEFQLSGDSGRISRRESGNGHHLARNSELTGPGMGSLEHLVMSVLKIGHRQDIEWPYASDKG